MSRQSDFAPSPAVESVHQDDAYNTHGPASRRSPYVLEEEHAQHDVMLLDRRREHRPPTCWECSQAEWLAVMPEEETA
jgi:hypothetical protein